MVCEGAATLPFKAVDPPNIAVGKFSKQSATDLAYPGGKISCAFSAKSDPWQIAGTFARTELKSTIRFSCKGKSM